MFFKKADPFAISPAFMTMGRKWWFEYVKPVFMLYDEDGQFVKEFRSFRAMNKYILQKGI